MTTNYPLTIEDFKTWLEAKNGDEVVGWQGWCKGCPIFKCLKDKKETLYSVNYESTHFLTNRVDTIGNPLWVKKFIERVDDRSVIPLKQGEMNASVTAKQALEVLEST